ncbi:carbonic anhydrase [Pararhodobacter sp. CCB-MM2]|uniref:carbonic anhydrase n=1 Tax=Pararhodobacter sp. CCB-MM2 TaxID=1786003 RepID=UPI00082BDA69|nr:carbonic anhydrase [Pararhodobacter sp. CCB-MM2]MCA2011488.1 carbonic anhydrase [Cereibacter sphaeroides]
MTHARKLPGYLTNRFRGWRATQYAENKSWFRHLAQEGQHPRSMLIACCDSRVHVTAIFGADQGEFFIHRNIANLVPPYTPDGQQHGTSAAVEYAVTALKVAHVIVVGHSNCGGVRGCHDMCAGKAPELAQSSSFVGTWMEILRPGYEATAEIGDAEARISAMEKQAVRISLSNLMSFPFVKEAVENETLTLHGLWHDIGEGGLEAYDPETDSFHSVL